MPRVCNRQGCGRRIVGKDGRPRYDRHFCGADCLREDKRERLAEMRRKARMGTCRTCGRKAVKDASQNTVVKLHNASPANFARTIDTKQAQDAMAP